MKKITVNVVTNLKKNILLYEDVFKTTINDFIVYLVEKNLISNQFDVINVFVTNNATIRKLNNDFRNKDKVTNVLSFILSEIIDDERILGEMVFSLQRIKLEADIYNKKFIFHLKHLIVHSCLHLLGYDHQNITDQNLMESIEIDFLNVLNIDNPYEMSS